MVAALLRCKKVSPFVGSEDTPTAQRWFREEIGKLVNRFQVTRVKAGRIRFT
ncbi:hypothetical protein D777_01493 [Marinobacter nitratireducens]|uniref:Uncharacterized protein n=1 Tax=Marinobacter nitratireducens TaxID=1137280 RepID=A0A072N3I0_9GAMM|nr:hypothetical protein D777_01493 [Marinobacter nitratireducens]